MSNLEPSPTSPDPHGFEGSEGIRNIDTYDLETFDHTQLRRDLVKNFGHISETANILNFLRCLILYSLGWVAMLLVEHPWARLLIAIPMAFNLVGIFILQHDAGHRSRSKNRVINDTVGDVAGGLFGFGIPWIIAREQHRIHHRMNASLYDDTALWMPMTISEFRLASPAQRFFYRLKMTRAVFSFLEYASFRTILPSVLSRSPERRRRIAPEIRRAAGVSVALNVGLISLAYTLDGGWGVLFLYFIPNFLSINIGTIVERLSHTHPDMKFYDEEAHCRDERDMQGTITITYPSPIAYLMNYMNEASIHHYVPSIPSYNQPAARAYVERHYPGLFNTHPFSWRHLTLVYQRCHLLRSPADPSYVSFCEAERTTFQWT